MARLLVLISVFALVNACGRTGATDANIREVLGVVSEVTEDRQSVVISHEDIPGFMSAMVMRFNVADPSILEGVEPDDEVRFRLTLKPHPHITEIKVLESERRFPAFKLKTVDGSELDSAQLKGKVVLINFWATWCAPCRMEIPWLVELKAKYGDRGFEIIGIAVDPENTETIAEFARTFSVNYPFVYSDGKIQSDVGGILGLPTSYIVDRQGKILKKHLGIISRDSLAAEIEPLL